MKESDPSMVGCKMTVGSMCVCACACVSEGLFVVTIAGRAICSEKSCDRVSKLLLPDFKVTIDRLYLSRACWFLHMHSFFMVCHIVRKD